MDTKRFTAPDAAASKGNRRLAVITAYDAGQAAIAEKGGAWWCSACRTPSA